MELDCGGRLENFEEKTLLSMVEEVSTRKVSTGGRV